MLRRAARTAATIALTLSVLAVGLLGLVAALTLSTAPTAPASAAPAPSVSASAVTSTMPCWIEHKSDADGGDETVCGDPGDMPAGSTPILLDA